MFTNSGSLSPAKAGNPTAVAEITNRGATRFSSFIIYLIRLKIINAIVDLTVFSNQSG
jgi:hypothetical protein